MTEKRKAEHLRICLQKDVQARQLTTGFEDIFLVHKALPEIRRDKINLSTIEFDHKFSAPIIIEAMTGGIPEATEINATIAQTVEELGLGMGVGSQRAAIESPEMEESFTIAREKAPTAFLIANIGGPQIIEGNGSRKAKRAIEMINADALAIHLNPLQEAVQPEGETNYEGVLKKIEEVAHNVDVPVIVKETGAGIASEEAELMNSIGVTAIDVAGAGGTSWAAVEYHRAKKVGDELRQRLGELFWNWGIPTATSVVEVVQSSNKTVIASGGVRTGIDVAKALALGADLAGIALPILRPAIRGEGEVKKFLRFLIQELKNTMFLTGANSIKKMKRVPIVITGKTADWLSVRGFQPKMYSKRKMLEN